MNITDARRILRGEQIAGLWSGDETAFKREVYRRMCEDKVRRRAFAARRRDSKVTPRSAESVSIQRVMLSEAKKRAAPWEGRGRRD